MMCQVLYVGVIAAFSAHLIIIRDRPFYGSLRRLCRAVVLWRYLMDGPHIIRKTIIKLF